MKLLWGFVCSMQNLLAPILATVVLAKVNEDNPCSSAENECW